MMESNEIRTQLYKVKAQVSTERPSNLSGLRTATFDVALRTNGCVPFASMEWECLLCSSWIDCTGAVTEASSGQSWASPNRHISAKHAQWQYRVMVASRASGKEWKNPFDWDWARNSHCWQGLRPSVSGWRQPGNQAFKANFIDGE